MGLFEDIVSNAAKSATKNATMRTIGSVASEALRAVGDVTVDVMAESKKNKPERAPRKQKPEYLKAPNPEDYIGVHYLKARSAFLAYGFTDISLVPQKDLRKGWLTKDGAVEEISINGVTTFRKREKYPPNSSVVIIYHTFKDGYGSNTNNQHASTETAPPASSAMPPEIPSATHGDPVPFIYCGHCGKKQKVENQFCIACGNALEK